MLMQCLQYFANTFLSEKMFASLKKKLQEEGGTNIIPGTKSVGSSTPTGAKAAAVHSVHGDGKYDYCSLSNVTGAASWHMY